MDEMLERLARRRVHQNERRNGGEQHDAGGFGGRVGEFDNLHIARLVTAHFINKKGVLALAIGSLMLGLGSLAVRGRMLGLGMRCLEPILSLGMW